MLRCASSFVIAAYAKVRLIMGTDFKSVPVRALPAAFLRSRPIFATFKTYYEVVMKTYRIISKEIAMSRVDNRGRYFTLGFMLVVLSAMILFGFAQFAQADGRGPGHSEFRDSRYNHNRSYPARGQIVREIPRGHRVVVHDRTRYYFFGGAWYRPQGPRFP